MSRISGRLGRRLRCIGLIFAVAFLMLTVAPVAALRWIDPPASSFMLQHRLGAWLDGARRPYARWQWVPWDHIAPVAALAVVAAEDQRFPQHHGFDLVEIRNALAHPGRRPRGASTLSQQVAKNLFLWGGRSWVRKGLEAYLTVVIETLWPKRRILEIYLNVAQLGGNTYGVGAASRRYFHKPAAALNLREASLLAAVLPNPVRLRVAAPSAYVRERAAWIRTQVRQLGRNYLDSL